MLLLLISEEAQSYYILDKVVAIVIDRSKFDMKLGDKMDTDKSEARKGQFENERLFENTTEEVIVNMSQ